MPKLIMTVTVLLALAGAGCASTNSSLPTGCVDGYPDAGVSDAVCAVAWSCSDDQQHYQIACTLDGSNYRCTCSSDTSNNGKVVVINAFTCSLGGEALSVAAQCGWNLQM
jgi:hypothetical protein